jgi:GNAT superfamily N-acetyltransferase
MTDAPEESEPTADDDRTADDAPTADDGPTVRRGREGDLLAVLRTIEGAMLEVGANQVRRRTESGEVLVAEQDGRVVGALVRDGDHVEALAVHQQRRRAGVGSLLVERALAETGHLTAEFREEVRPFYESLAFEVEEREAGDEDEGEVRLWGERTR